MSVEKIASLGVSLAGWASVRAVSGNIPPQTSQTFFISSLSGAFLGVITGALINIGLPTMLGHVIYPVVIGSSALFSIDLFSRLQMSPIGHWEFIQNRVVVDIGTLAGFTSVMLIGHIILNIQELLNPQRDQR